MTNDLISSEVTLLVKGVVDELGIKNYTIDVSPGSLHGDNYLSIIAKVVVCGKNRNGKDKIANFIVKSSLQNEACRSITPVRFIFDREIYIYSKVFPEMEKLQSERAISNPFNSYPKFYKSTVNHMNEAIIMEDMKELGFVSSDRFIPLNFDHVLMVMKEYGRFHALSFALRKHKPELFKEIIDNTQGQVLDRLDQYDVFAVAVETYCNNALQTLSPIKDNIAYQKLKFSISCLGRAMKVVLNSSNSGKHTVVGHGDSWMNNMLFKYKDNSPTQVCFLDWQLACAGSPALDLSYFIFSCTDKSLRDQYHIYFIHEYYNSLSSFLQELGCDPEELFPFNVLQEHLKRFSLYGLFMSFMTIYVATHNSEDIPDISNMTHKNELIDKIDYGLANEQYGERIRGVIEDFIRFGYDFIIE